MFVCARTFWLYGVSAERSFGMFICLFFNWLFCLLLLRVVLQCRLAKVSTQRRETNTHEQTDRHTLIHPHKRRQTSSEAGCTQFKQKIRDGDSFTCKKAKYCEEDDVLPFAVLELEEYCHWHHREEERDRPQTQHDACFKDGYGGVQNVHLPQSKSYCTTDTSDSHQFQLI